LLAGVVLLTAAPAVNAQFPVYPFYGYGPSSNPYGGYLNGAAALTTANANYQVTIQQARLLREQSRQAALETYRRERELRAYELALRPTPEQMREREQALALQRSLNDPPSVEVWSGQSLNTLLTWIQKAQAQGVQGPSVPLPPNVLSQVNFTTGSTAGNVGVLRQGGELHWPLVLKGNAFREETTRLEELVQEAVSQAASGSVDAALRTEMGETLDQLSAKVDARVAELTPTQYVQAKRYLRELKATWKSLEDPDVSRYFSRAWTPQGSSVGDLVGQMTREGLRFAPSVTGGEPAYTALHHALVTYSTQMMVAARR
jgi:hypothetical protein